MNIIYNPYILYSLTGNTNYFSGSSSDIVSNIDINSGFTLIIGNFDNNTINRVDIINNLIDYIDGDINKYQLTTLIVNDEQIFDNITKIGYYCVKFSYNTDIEQYIIMNIVKSLETTTTTTTTIKNITTTTTTKTKSNVISPIIYYNYPISGTTWIGGGNNEPHDAYLHLYHNGISGWTLDSLKYLFISGITECFGEKISLDNIIFNLYEEGSAKKINGINKYGVYYIHILVSGSVGITKSSYIYNIIVNDSPPNIIFDTNILTSSLTGNTMDFSIATGITDGIYIGSGFTLNLNDFDKNIITNLDIINILIDYVIDYTDKEINKYKSNILIVGSKFIDYNNIVYPEIIYPGYYCIKISLKNSIGNEIVYYVMLFIIYDISIYSEGYWQDNKVWIDSTKWLDHPIIHKN